MEERAQMQELYKAATREKIAAGMVSLRAGQGSDSEAFMAQLLVELDIALAMVRNKGG